MPIIVTTPYSDARYGSKGAVLVKEVSGVTTARAAQAASGMAKGLRHPENGAFICDNWDGQPLSPDFWRLTFAFSPVDFQQDDNPLATPTTILWGDGLSQQPIDRDKDGNGLFNACGEPFDESIQGDFIELTFSVVRFEAAPFNVAQAVAFCGGVNEGSVTIQGNKFEDGQAMVQRIAPAGEYTLSATALPVQYDFRCREEGFDVRLLNQGTRCFFPPRYTRGGGSDLMELHDVSLDSQTGTVNVGDQVNHPVLLDETGMPLRVKKYVNKYGDYPIAADAKPTGATFEKTKDGRAVFVIYKTKKRVKLTQLGL